MNEIEELYQLLQGKVKTGTLEEFTQRMQDPKSLAAVKKYAQEKIKPSTNLEKFNEGFAVKPAAKVADKAPVQEQVSPAKVGVQAPKTGTLRLPEEDITQAPQMKITGFEGLKPSELAAVKSRKEAELTNYKAEIDKLDQDIQTRFSNQVVNPNDPAVLKRDELAAKFDGFVSEYEKINTEAEQRLNEPIKTFSYTDPYEFLNRAKKETPQLTSDERKAQAEAAQAPLRGGPVPFSGQDYYLGPVEREQMSNFINTQFADVPEDLRLSLEVYLGKLGERDPNAFERIISRTGEPGQAFKSELLEKTLHGKINEVVQDADILAERIKADKQSQQQMQMLAEAKALIKQLEGKAANQDENDALEQAYAVVEQLKGTTVGQYAQKLEDYDNLFRTYRGVIELYPDELRHRKRIADKYDAVTYKEGDSAITKAKKQAIATWGSVQNAVVDATANFIKTSVQAGPNIARAISGSNQQTATDEYADRLGSWMDAYLKAPSLNPESSQVFAKDLMGNTTVNAKAIIPATAKTVTDMAMLIYGGAAFGGGKAGLVASGFVQNYNDLLEEALQQPNMDYRKAVAYASTVGLITAGLETVSPQGLAPGLFSSSKKAALSKLMDLSSKNFGKASSVVVKEILKDVPAENLQEAMQLVSEKILNYGFNTALGTNFDDQVRKEEAYETVLLTSAATTVFGFLNRKSRKQWEAVEAARLLKEKPEELEVFLSQEVESGRVDIEQARSVYKFVEDVKKQDDAAEAAKPIDKKVEALTQEKPILEEYKGETEIEIDEYFAKDVPTGVIVNWDGKKYEVRTDDKGTTLTLMEEVVEEQPEGESTEVAPQVELKPTKQKLTVEEFNELVQAPQGERVETELENAQVAEYQGKEYKITETQGDQVVLENYAGTARMTVPASEVKPFAVAPLVTITIEGQQFKADQKQQQALQLIDQVEQDQIEKINSSNLTDVQKKSQTKAIQEAFKRSRKEILGVKEELKTGQEVYFGGKQVKIKSLTKNTAKVEMDGVVTTVPRSSLSLSDTAPLDTLAQELKDEAQVKGHVYTIDSASLNLSEEDNRAYLKADTHTANIVGKVKKLLPALAKSGIKIKVYSDPLSAKEAALKAGAAPRGVESRFYEGKEVVSELYQGEGLTEVTFEDGTTEIVKTDDIKTSSFGGYFDPTSKTILINAQVAGASTVEHEFLHPVIESILIDNPEIVATFFEQIKKMPEWADLKDFVEQYDAREQPIEALIEFTARIIAPEFKYQTRRPTFKRAVVDFFRRIFRIAGPIVNINSKNVLDFAESLKKSFELGRTFDIKDTAGGFSIRAYHGTPHDFDKFTTEKIGTGEGAQAFGWGLYFTELEDIARYYADKLTEPEIFLDGKELQDNSALLSTWFIVASADTIEQARDLLIEWGSRNRQDLGVVNRSIRELDSATTFEVKKNRNLYDVTLHKDKTEYNWLEWDKPVSDDSIVKIFEQAEKEGGIDFKDGWELDNQGKLTNKAGYAVKGEEMYDWLSKKLGSPKAASLFLSEAGIDGVKYPAESLSGKQARGFNYVIFDENAVTVNEKIRFSKQTLLAPNGKPSNLTPEQYVQVRTPEFKAWFGDWENSPETASKVIDKNGEPLVVYHGTNNTFSSFDKRKSKNGFYFAPKKERLIAYNKANINDYYLNIKNPSNEIFIDNIKELSNKGYDGVMEYGYAQKINEYLYEIIAFSPTQIKSATENVGSFSPTNPDIRFSKAYHKGTLAAKSEGVGSTISGSEVPYTGYFFVSSDDKLKGRQRAMAGDDIQQIDLSQYNLYNPRTNENYFRVLEALRNIPTIGTPERLEKEIDSAISKLPQDLKVQVEENKAQILTALVENSALAEQRRVEPSDGKNVVDKAATVVLKQLGYEGVNATVSLTDSNLKDPDSTGYGTVVFDIKDGTVSPTNPDIRFSKANQFSRGALTIPEMELSFDKFRDLALLWKAYNPTKSEADFYEYVRANVDKRVNKGFMSAAFNDDATYLQKRKDAELDTRSKNLNAQSRGTLGYMADPNVPQFIKDRLKTEQLRYETEPNSVTEKTVDYIIQNYDLSNAEAVLESIQVPAVRTRLADKLIDRLNKLGRDAATAEEKTEYYYAALKLTENNIHYMRSLGRGIQIHSQYSKMDKEGVAFAVNKMMKINRSGLKKAHKTAIDRMVAYARLVERGQRKALITDEVKTQVLSGGKTKEQIRNLKESAAKKLRAIGAQGFSVAPDRQSLLDYGYYEFLDGRRSKASWVKHMTDRGLSDAADVYDYHNFGTAQNPETLADFSDRVESLSDLIGTPALAQAIGQPLADKINAEHRKRVVSALRDKYKKDLKKKGIAGQMAAALITAVEKGQYDSDVLLDELAKTVGAVELTQDDIKIIDEIYKRAATYPEGRIRDEELAKAWDYIYARSRDSLKYGDMYWSFFYANILSGPGTHALNLIENALNIILEPTVQIADQITRVNTQGLSRRTVAWNMASGVLRGLFGAGVREGLSVVVTGKEKFRGANKYFDSNALEQIAKGTAGKGLLTTILRPAATVMRYVPRALAAADAFYNQAHFEMGSATVAAQIVRQEVDTKVIDKKDAKARYYEILGDNSWWVTALRDAEIEIKEAYRLQGKELTNDFDTWYKIKTRAREIVLNKRQEAASKYVYNDIGGASSDMAAIGTYTNAPRGVLGAVATHAAGLVADVPIARHVIPFVNIVANVYNRQLDYTPWGLARAAAILTKGGKSDFIAEGKEKYSWNTHEGAAKQHIIKSVMGTAAMIAAYLLFWDDDDNVFTDCDAFTIHGRGPTDYTKKKEMEARGWKPYSFQYKGKFYAFNWTPFNLALSFIANAIDKQRYGKNDEDKSALDNTLIAFNLLGSTLLSAAFVKSAADFLSFFQEGKEESDRLWNFLGRTAISSVPAPMALFNAIHSTVDNTKYQADSVSQGILRNIPIAKTQLKPALNAFGEVITKTGISQDMTWYRVGELTGLNRFMSSLDTNDTTFAWLHQNGLWPPVIGKTKELFGNKVSDETHYKLVEICGPNIKRMIEFDKAYIDKIIAEDGVVEANKYINQKLKDRIVDFVEDAIIDQYNFKPDEETIIELKDVDWEKVRKYVTDATNEMMVPVE